MNLSDLIRRRDRSFKLLAGNAIPTTRVVLGCSYEAVALDPGTRLVLSDAHEFTALRTFPASIGWKVVEISPKIKWPFHWQPNRDPVAFKVRLVANKGERSHLLFSAKGPFPTCLPVRLDWPLWQGGFDRFDIEIEAGGHTQLCLTHGPVFHSGKALLPVLQGSGAEVGPGANPFLRPDGQRSLTYIEAAHADQWRVLYEKGKSNRPQVDPGLWARYVVGDARTIDCCPADSLDFIFSKHVVEHLINPIQVMENWAQKLRPGGAIAGVVPDLRYTFDLRQSPSTVAEWLSEYEEGLSEIPRRAYERWCRYTAPYNTPDDLIARSYSIHVHYYTPDNFLDLLQLLRNRALIRSYALKISPNHKDFAFVAWT